LSAVPKYWMLMRPHHSVRFTFEILNEILRPKSPALFWQVCVQNCLGFHASGIALVQSANLGLILFQKCVLNSTALCIMVLK